MNLSEIAVLLAVNLAVITAVMAVLWLVAVRLRDVSFIDAVWPMGMLLMALITLPRTEGDPTRGMLLLWLCGVWALRLGGHLFIRWRGHGADGRYLSLVQRLEEQKGWSFNKTALLAVFLLSGCWGGSERQASAMTTALSPDRTMLIRMIWESAIQKTGSDRKAMVSPRGANGSRDHGGPDPSEPTRPR